MNLCEVLVKLAINPVASARMAPAFSPEAFEQGSSGVADVFKQTAAPSAPGGGGRGSFGAGGTISERLTPALGGGRQSFSTQTPQSTEWLESRIKSRGLDLGRVQGIVRQMHGADTPEGYNRVLNTFNTEAGFNSNATGDRGRSVGVGQINFDAHPEYAKLNLRDPYINLGVARDIWNRQGPQNAYKTTWDRLGYSRQ